MASIKLKFRPSKVNDKKGSLYIQVIHDRNIKRIKTKYHIFNEEWDVNAQQIKQLKCTEHRYRTLSIIIANTQWEINKLKGIVFQLSKSASAFSVDDIIKNYQKTSTIKNSVFEFIHMQTIRLKDLGRTRTSEIYKSLLNSFMRFRNYNDIDFSNIDSEIIELYEAELKKRGLSRNTTAFYMRTFKTIYKLSIKYNLTDDNHPFENVYCGIEKTIKRAILLGDVKRIKEMDLTHRPALDYARDMFIISFCLRGMSFVDMAYLRKKDLLNGVLTYRRRKTGQCLSIEWPNQVQMIVDKYKSNNTQYLLPIISNVDIDERRQYQNQLLRVNRHLKTIAKMACISTALSMYYSRHSWASIARNKEVPISVISSALGHTSIETTQIYLDSIRQTDIDEANRIILRSL